MRTIALSATVCGLALAVAGISVGNDFDLLLEDLTFGDAPSLKEEVAKKPAPVARPATAGMFMPVVEAPEVTLKSPKNGVQDVVVADPNVDFESIFGSQDSAIVVAEPVSVPMDMHPGMINDEPARIAQVETTPAAPVELPQIEAPVVEAPAAPLAEAAQVDPPVAAAPPAPAEVAVPEAAVVPEAVAPVQPEPIDVQPELLPVDPHVSQPEAPVVESPVVMPLSDPQFIDGGHCGGTACDGFDTYTCRPHVKPNLPHSTFYQYFRSNPCYSNVWDGYRRCCPPHHSHIHGTCDCLNKSKNKGFLGVKNCGCDSCSSCDR